MTSFDDLEKTCIDRFDNYAILSRLFRIEVDRDLLKELADVETLEPDGGELFNEGYRELRSYLDGIEDIDRSKSELAIDYALVFLGYGSDPNEKDESKGMNAAYPYESIYLSGKKALTGGLSDGVSAEYALGCFRPNKQRIAADDHIACELEFLQHLVNSEMEALAADDSMRLSAVRRLESDFIEAHLLKWIGPFRKEIENRAETEFYKALAKMTEGWLRDERAALKETL